MNTFDLRLIYPVCPERNTMLIERVVSSQVNGTDPKLMGEFTCHNHLKALNDKQRALLKPLPVNDETMWVHKCADAVDLVLRSVCKQELEQSAGIAVYSEETCLLTLINTVAKTNGKFIKVDILKLRAKPSFNLEFLEAGAIPVIVSGLLIACFMLKD